MSKLRRMLIAITNRVSYIIDIPLVTVTDKTGDTNMFSGSPFIYGSTYKITFNYSVTVKTAYAGNMVIAIRNYSAFDYVALKSINASALGTYTGSISYTANALKNEGDILTVMFRAYTGLADCTLSNIKVEKVG